MIPSEGRRTRQDCNRRREYQPGRFVSGPRAIPGFRAPRLTGKVRTHIPRTALGLPGGYRTREEVQETIRANQAKHGTPR
jgi:hypothetical protein